MDKIGLNQKFSTFFKNYLARRKTKYLWKYFLSPFYNVDVRVGQESALSPIFSALYLFLIFHILEKTFKNPKNSIISFVDDSLFISQNKSILHSNANLFYSYNVFSFLLTKFGLVVKHGKTEVFHLSGLYKAFNPPPLDLTTLGGPILLPKASWQYLGFFFDQELTFQHHIKFVTNFIQHVSPQPVD